ncbi:MAG: ABC-F family ATP-binding cassette domain-containing protein [Candidatus Dormibacteraeota bacterium]|uniref:ABC-F family ATP-binding cassette domain-containing protein n=1 Tax=Candidatus Amunia macphersoniae TaxID=3127014 RepID=A0A934NGD4_9BACT|nr:ABC-F family ATP-binding cassette domain-containing protein [Candidatus Dormibacteraeota bacterium]
MSVPTPIPSGRPLVLTLTSARVEIGARTLLKDTSLLIKQGEKVALVGANGMGKTTLLRSIAGDHTLTAGSVMVPNRTGYLRQETPRLDATDGQTALDYLMESSPLTAMHREMDRLTAAMSATTGAELDMAIEQYGELQDRFAQGGGYELEATAEQIANGVGLDDETLLTPVAALSGGQRRKLDLAGLLLAGGDLFILDEPTNHLDVSAKRWVMNFLGQTEATVLVVSHDLKLMDSSFDRVLALENAQIDSYKGTYSDFVRQRAESAAQRAHQARSLGREASRLTETKKVFSKGNATHAAKRRALQRRIDALTERMKDHAPPVQRRQLRVRFPEPERAGDQVLDVTGLSKAFDAHQVFSGVELNLRRGDMLLLVGVNGAGKTTLLRCLAGRETPDCGSVRIGANVKVGYYAQEHEDILPMVSVLDNLRSSVPDASEGELRGVLGHFGLVGDVAAQRAGTLSGGEKTKLALARLMVARANLLLLDEPTNNLDPQSVEALLAALQHYEGTVVLVSHDAEFVSQLAPERILLLPESQVTYFDEKILEMIPQR